MKKKEEAELTERVCLGKLCKGEKTFMSSGIHNRVCDKCKAAEQYTGKRTNRYISG